MKKKIYKDEKPSKPINTPKASKKKEATTLSWERRRKRQ